MQVKQLCDGSSAAGVRLIPDFPSLRLDRGLLASWYGMVALRGCGPTAAPRVCPTPLRPDMVVVVVVVAATNKQIKQNQTKAKCVAEWSSSGRPALWEQWGRSGETLLMAGQVTSCNSSSSGWWWLLKTVTKVGLDSYKHSFPSQLQPPATT